MTHTTYTSPRLERPRDSAVKGVCTALARTTGTDPVLWRVLTVVLVFFGGLGLLLYLAGIVFIPAEGEPASLGERLLHGPDRTVSVGQVLLVALLAVVFGGFFLDDHDDGLIVGLVVGALALLWWREHPRPAAPGRPRGHDVVTAADAAAAPLDAAPVNPANQPIAAPLPWNPPPPRPRSPFGGLTASAALVIAGVLLLIGASGAASIPIEVVIAAALATVGAGLVAGSFFGRAPGLVVLAVMLALALGATAGVRPAIEAGVGDRTWRPAGSGSYRLGIGEATLDLRSLVDPGPTEITARVDVGHLLVVIPEDMRVSIDARAGLGDVQLFGADYDGRRVDRHIEVGPADGSLITLDLSVRTGMVEVRHG